MNKFFNGFYVGAKALGDLASNFPASDVGQSRKKAQRIAQTNLSNMDDTDRLPVVAAAFSQGWIAFRNK